MLSRGSWSRRGELPGSNCSFSSSQHLDYTAPIVPQLLLTCSLIRLFYLSTAPLQSQLGLRPFSSIWAFPGLCCCLGWLLGPGVRGPHAAVFTPTLQPTIPCTKLMQLSETCWENWILAPAQLWGQWSQQLGRHKKLPPQLCYRSL